MGYEFDWALFPRIAPRFLPAIWLTIEVFVLAQLLSTAIAITCAVSGNAFKAGWLRRVLATYS